MFIPFCFYEAAANLLTNPAQKAARAAALRMAFEHTGDQLFLLFSATTSIAQGPAASAGYGPNENDQDQPGNRNYIRYRQVLPAEICRGATWPFF